MSRVLFLGDIDALRNDGASRLLQAGHGEQIIVAQPGLETCDSVASLPAVDGVMMTGGQCTMDSCFVERASGASCEERTCTAKRLWSQLQAVTRRGDLACVAFAGECEVDRSTFEYMSSPNTDVARLCSLLFHRWRSLQPGARVVAAGPQCDPAVLRDTCVEQAILWRRPMVFQHWLSEDCTWASTETEA